MKKTKAFVGRKKISMSALMQMLIPIAFTLVIVCIVLVGINNVNNSSHSEQLKIMSQSIRRAAVQCYAVEGSYPQNLDYLQNNYGLLLDKERYVYHYEMIAANIMPQITVFTKE